MRNIYIIVFFILMACIGCQWQLQPTVEHSNSEEVVLARFDRAERLFLTTGDFAALQQMKTVYPIETRTLIEKILELGNVDEPDINSKLLSYFQDSTLQAIISDVEI